VKLPVRFADYVASWKGRCRDTASRLSTVRVLWPEDGVHFRHSNVESCCFIRRV